MTNTPSSYTNSALLNKITDMYPDIKKHGIALSLELSAQENVYKIKLEKAAHVLTTHLEKSDADECMNGIKCVYLGVQIGEFLKNFEEADNK